MFYFVHDGMEGMFASFLHLPSYTRVWRYPAALRDANSGRFERAH